MANDRISELKYMPIETYQTEIQREKLLKKKKKTAPPPKQEMASNNCGTISKDIAYPQLETREEKESKAEEIFKVTISENFPKLISDSKAHIQKAQILRSGVNTKKKTIPKHIISRLQKVKNKQKTFKEVRQNKIFHVAYQIKV